MTVSEHNFVQNKKILKGEYKYLNRGPCLLWHHHSDSKADYTKTKHDQQNLITFLIKKKNQITINL